MKIKDVNSSINPFNRDSEYYFADRLVTDSQIEEFYQWANGTLASKRCRGTWTIPTFKAGRLNRTRVGDVFAAGMPDDNKRSEAA